MKVIYKNDSSKVFRLLGIYAGILIFTFQSFNSNAQLISFPGAEGAGRFTSGGRGTVSVPTTVYEVTNLNDDNNAGSLRYALTQSATYRTVVFRISGTIHLTANLNVPSNTTIAGQTAPGDGICIADKPLTINGNNIIIRYIRVRLGDRYQQAVNGNDDAMSGTGKKNIMIDHCTMGWSNDESFTIYDGDSTTAQWNIISEPLNFSYHDEGSGIQNHGYGGIWGGRKSSFHHNLIVSCLGRNPRFNGSRTMSPFTAGLENVDFRNNVIYNWGSYSSNGGEGGNYNMVNNYYKYGPSTSTGSSTSVPVRGMIVQPFQSTSTPVLPYGKFYITGNYVDGYSTITNNNWLGVSMSGGTQNDTTQAKVTTPFDIGPVTTHTAQEAYNLVLQFAGASFVRDTLDQRIVNDVLNRTGRIIDVQGGYPHGTPYANTVNAWPTLNSTTAPTDTDHDGMPDSYETANSLDPNDASDRNGIAANGYTNLENYLNGIVNAPTISAMGTLHAFTQNIPNASAIQNFTLAGLNLTNDITVTPPASYEVSGDGGVTWKTNASPLTVTQSGGAVSPKVINVRLKALTPGSYSGNITSTSSGATMVNLSVSGSAFQSTAPPGTALVVAKDGSGDYTTVQAAIDAAPTGQTTPYIIFIKNGNYFEKITVPSNKPFIHLVGESVANVLLYYNTGASDPLPGGGTVGTQNSASFTVSAPDFAAFNITFANTYGDGSQAVAVLVNNDRAVFKNCRFLGNQDTLYIKGGGTPRHYFKDCYIDGNVDFIFGSAISVFDSTTIYAKTRTSTSSSYLTAANTPAGQAYGFVFRNCMIPDNTGGTKYVLGRPWQNSTGSNPLANNKTVFLSSRMSSSIKPEGWAVWDAGTMTNLIYYGEYQSKLFDGSLVDISQRVPWSFQLNGTEASTYTNANLFGSWDPCAVSAMVCTNEARDIAVANFRGVKGASNSTFDWNISWAKDQIKYELYRSLNRTSGYTKISEITSVNDTSVNFQMTDVLPVAGTSYYYYLVASKTGFASHITDTIEISGQPTIITSGNIQPFGQNLGTPSGTQTLTVSGENLLGNVVITPPVNFQISSNGGTTWVTNPSTISLTPTGNTLAATDILVRLNASAAGMYTDSIMMTTTSGQTKYVVLNGTTVDGNAPSHMVLQHWPMTMNADDSTAIRAVGVLPSTPTLYRLYVSNGTQVPTIPAYSPQFGQAFGASTNGDGSWGTSAGGPGGTLQRTWYEEFTVTADNGYKVRLDSLYVTAAFYNTSSNTRLAVVYSRSAFINDSSDVFTSPGGFANPIPLPNQTAGPTATFPLSFAGIDGITLMPGEKLTFRFYFSCSSSSQGRYAMVKDVKVIGESIDLSTLPGVLQHWPMTMNANDSIDVRSPGVTASTPSLYRLYVSNGTQVPTIPAYSDQYGQAIGATANGDGSWGSSAGGPGGTLQRTWYEEFTVTAKNGYRVRVDSIFVTAAFYNTSSNTRLAVVYSRSNFVNDSSDVSTIPGGFSNPIPLANQTSGPTNTYNLAVNGIDGVTLQPGEVLTFRFYFSCSSSSPGRYAMVKNVKAYGLATDLSTIPGIIQHWPFATGAADSLSVRSPGVTPSTPSLYRLYVSNGTQVPTIPAYSDQYGQAIGATANGDGSWGSSAGGPGGTLQRTWYEEFTVTAKNGYQVKVDSIFVTAAFYNTSSNTRLAVVYSRSGFVNDSSDVSTIPGGFSNPIPLANQTSGPTNTYNLAVNGIDGVTLQPGERLTFRFYFSCSSSSPGRYAMVKDVKVFGLATNLGGTPDVIQHWPFATGAADSANVRATGIMASTPSLYRLYVSNGTQVPAIPAYSNQYGQALGATANGDGSWGSSAGGPGGTLQRTWYEEFTVTPESGNMARVDSIFVTAAFYNTSSNTRLGVVYSKSGFVSDSSDVSASPGGFNDPIPLANQSTGPTNMYHLAVNGSNGVTILPGEKLTFRFYFSCSSSSPGRYAMVKDVKVFGLVSAAGPSGLISTTNAFFAPFSQNVGTPSAEQAYTVSAAGLTSDLMITPPNGYEISADGGTTWHTNASPLSITPVSGTVDATSISVRLNAGTPGSYTGNLSHTSAGAASVNVPLSGTAYGPAAITVTASLSNFSQTVGAPSATQSYTVSGTNIISNLTITPPAGFEVSGDGGATWHNNSSPLTLSPTSGIIASTTISVRLNASSAGTYSGNITHESTNATTQTVAVNGTTVNPPSISTGGTITAFLQSLGAPTAAKSYTVSGSDLLGNIVITPPANFQISRDGTTWIGSSSSITLTPVNGSVSSTTIQVRLNATAVGNYSGNIVHTSTNAPTVNVPVSGQTIPAEAITVAPAALNTFSHIVGTPSTSQSYNVTGVGLLSNITITAPPHYQVSTNGGQTWSTTATLTRSNFSVQATVQVRLNATVPGTFTGNIVHQASVASTNLPVTGYASLGRDYIVYPVPAVTTIFITHPVLISKGLIIVYSASGQKLRTYDVQPGTPETTIDISRYPGGLYYAEYMFGEIKKIVRFVKR